MDARLAVATRSLRGRVTITARNESGGGIDRLELNTVMGPLGALRLGAVTVDGTAVAARLDDQTIIVPLGGVLPADATAVIVVPFSATLRRRRPAATGCSRGRTASSTCTAGSRGSAAGPPSTARTTATRSSRP